MHSHAILNVPIQQNDIEPVRLKKIQSLRNAVCIMARETEIMHDPHVFQPLCLIVVDNQAFHTRTNLVLHHPKPCAGSIRNSCFDYASHGLKTRERGEQSISEFLRMMLVSAQSLKLRLSLT